MKRFTVCLLALALAAGAAPAQPPQRDHPAPAGDATAAMTRGEVTKIDKEAGKITLRHGVIENLKMPAMTMSFRVADIAMLDQVKVGDKVAFIVEKINGAFTVTKLEAAK